MQKATSVDGTLIAFDHVGQGPPVIIVVGAFNDHRTGAPLAAALSAHHTVFTYDRRGHGDSGNAPQYALERELDDLDAILNHTGPAAVFGYSSGAALAVQAAARSRAITRLALFELPPLQPAEHAPALAALVAAGRRGEAVEYFQRRMVGLPEEVIVQLRHAPFRAAVEAAAHTLVHDATIVATPLPRPAQPTVAIAGGDPVMRQAADALARSLPRGRAVTLERATHDLAPDLLAPVLLSFFAG